MEAHRKYDFKNLHYAGESGILIPALQHVQAEDGFISRERILEIHRKSGVPVAHIYGVATFYSQFRFHPVGKHIVRVCHGTACHVSGAKGISQAVEEHLKIGNGETTPDKLFTIETVSCLGCCSLAPVIMVGNDTYGNLKAGNIKKVFKIYKQIPAEVAP